MWNKAYKLLHDNKLNVPIIVTCKWNIIKNT